MLNGMLDPTNWLDSGLAILYLGLGVAFLLGRDIARLARISGIAMVLASSAFLTAAIFPDLRNLPAMRWLVDGGAAAGLLLFGAHLWVKAPVVANASKYQDGYYVFDKWALFRARLTGVGLIGLGLFFLGRYAWTLIG